MSSPPSSNLEILLGAEEQRLANAGAGGGGFASTPTAPRRTMIACCLCGTLIYPNAANQCGACLAQQFDLKALLNRGPGGGDLIVHQCRECKRFERQPTKYEACYMESPELMSLCLKHIPALHGNYSNGTSSTDNSHGSGIANVKVLDAAWVWTEPHSMRLRLKLTIRAGVVDGIVQIQQTLMVTFIIKNQQCPECKREYTSRTWQAVVQLRQKRSDGSPRKGIFLTEMAIRNNKDLRKHILNFETTRHGFDFYFLQVSQAQNFAQYLQKVAPMRTKTSTKLVSTDNHSNTANIKHTISCDLVPFGRDDLIVAARNGGYGDNGMGKLSGKLALVTKCKSVVHLVNGSPSRTSIGENLTELNPDKYWKAGEERCFRILMSPNRMVKFIVLDVELCGTDPKSNGGIDNGNATPSLYKGHQSGIDKYALADVEVARASDFGVNDETFMCVTHLGHLLQVGDTVLGYDLQASQGDSSEIMENLNTYFTSSFTMPDVVLVRKVQGIVDANDDEGEGDGKDDSNTKSKAKSSSSKKRTRRMKKEEKKMQDLESAASRMGFLGKGDNTKHDNDEEEDNVGSGKEMLTDISTKERDAFEEAIKHDPELEEELRLAEQAIQEGMMSSSTATPAASATDGEEKEEDTKTDATE